MVFVACARAGRKWRTARYVLLGDDILIGDARVAKQYLRILKVLGVETSPSKTYVSKWMCEFAKRLLFKGREVTPFPVSSVSDQWWSVPLVVSALRGEVRKGYFPLNGIPSAVRALQESVNPPAGRSFLRMVEEEAFLCELGTKLLSGEISAGAYFSALSGDPYLGGVEIEGRDFDVLTFTLLSYLFTSSLDSDGGAYRYYFETQRRHFQSCGSLDWPEFSGAYPALAVLGRMSGSLFKLESDMGRPLEKSDTWRELIKGMFNPFAVDPFGTDNPKRAARVSHRLGRLVRKIARSPELLAKLASDATPNPLVDRGLVLTLRTPGGLRDRAVFRVDHEEFRGLEWNQRLGKWVPKSSLSGIPGYLLPGGLVPYSRGTYPPSFMLL